MSPTKEAEVECPGCGKVPSFVEESGKYYCFTCHEYLEPFTDQTGEQVNKMDELIRDIEEIPEDTVVTTRDIDKIIEDTGVTSSVTDEITEEPDENTMVTDTEPTLIEEEEDFDYTPELESTELTEIQEEVKPKKPKKSKKRSKSKHKKRYSKYRYRTQMLKGCILPILYGVISLQLLNNYKLQFSDYIELEIMIILGGFILGFFAISSITIANLIRAKKNGKSGCNLNVKVGLVAYVPFIVILIALALFESIATAWKFSTGFFLAAIFPLIIVTLYETGSKGKFFVKELVGDSSQGRKLVFIQ
ncbi:MAG: hypothetical protein JSV56_12480 [Methanomassiliicoccales archaeon]|nr:MAG: hypothetical protein JSV56_12480 [Methanomassiliicoccales archaeon]